jgi:hypothetical protein
MRRVNTEHAMASIRELKEKKGIRKTLKDQITPAEKSNRGIAHKRSFTTGTLLVADQLITIANPEDRNVAAIQQKLFESGAAFRWKHGS